MRPLEIVVPVLLAAYLGWPLTRQARPINRELMVKIADTYILAFFNATLQGQPTDLFNGDFSAFPEVKVRQ